MSIAITNTDHYSNIADSVRYSKDAAAYESSLARAKAERDSIIDGSITSIESDATFIRQKTFTACRHLKTTVFSLAEEMGTDVFVDCTSLENALFLKLTNIGPYAFVRCPSFNLILHGRVRLPNINAFNLCSAIIYVKPEDLEWYSTATNWSTLYVQNRIKSIEDLTGDDLVWYQEQLARYQEVS